MRVRVSAPGKLMLMGEHAVVHGRSCLVMAVNKRIVMEVDERQVGVNESRFVRGVREEFEKKYGKIGGRIRVVEKFESEYGLGSSAAVTVATAEALLEFSQLKWSKKELFDFCFKVVRKVQGLGSGFDVAAAVYGGVIYFVTGGKKIEKLKLKSLSLVVGYSGVKADTVTMIKKAKISNEFLDKSERLVNRAVVALEKKDWVAVGELMNQNHRLLQTIGVSTPKLDAMVKVAVKIGVYGAKLSGAGGGDCMIALVDEKKKEQVEEAIGEVGGKALDLEIEQEGVRPER